GRQESGRREHTGEYEPALHLSLLIDSRRAGWLFVVLGDVVDRAGRSADAQTDQRALAGPVPGACADRGAGAGADGRARGGTAAGGRDTQQRQTEHARDELLRNHSMTSLDGQVLVF